MTEGHDYDESKLPPIPPSIGDITSGEPVHGPTSAEELARQEEGRLVALENEIADLAATRRGVQEEIQEGRGDANTRMHLEHVTEALLEAQAERNRIAQGF